MSTGYINSFITVAADCPAEAGVVPSNAESVPGLQYALLTDQPYGLTSDELLFAVHLRRHGLLADGDMEAAKAAFFAKSHPCLRASMLSKRYGWGVHYDEQGRIALYGVESDDYQRLAARPDLTILPAMRNKRA